MHVILKFGHMTYNHLASVQYIAMILLLPLAPFLILFCSCLVIQSQPQIICVKANDSCQCPNNIKYAMCQTFSWYIKNSSAWFKTNTVMLFQEGVHSLDAFIEVHNCDNFNMSGYGRAPQSSNGLPKPSSRIRCNGAPKSGLYFSHSTNISVHNLEFESCGGTYYVKKEHHLNFASSLAFSFVQDMSLDQVVISDAMGYALLTSNIYGTNKVENSAFLHSRKHPYAKGSGNAKFWFVDDCPKSDLFVTSSWFMYGRNNKSSNAAGGLNVYMNCSIGVHVTIFNVTTRGNSGTNGNLALYLVDYATGSGSSIVINHSRIMDGRGIKGGGLRFWSHHNRQTRECFTLNVHQIFTIIDTTFHNNSVDQTGGAMYIAYYNNSCLLYTSPSPRDATLSRMPSSA